MTRKAAQESSSDLSELEGESDLTDLEELGGQPAEIEGIAVNSKTGTLADPHTKETTALPATKANAKLLSATIPVTLVDDMPTPTTLDSPLTPGPASPDNQEPSRPQSLSKSLIDKVASLARLAFPYAAPASPSTETSESHSQSQADAI